MPQYAAFLRAVNVGKRLVKMETLRTAFGQMGFSNVQTVIASGNVVFETPQKRVSRIEQAIENGLADALGFDVTTFVRTGPELRALAAHPLVSGESLKNGEAVFVAFLRDTPAPETTRKLTAFQAEGERVVVHQHHVLWLVRGRFSDSSLSGPVLERTLGVPATLRNATTVRRMLDKFRAG
jgi:uncharacterized protein (DUF1697 family)